MRKAVEGVSGRSRGAAIAVAALGLTALAGCVEHLDRRETISPYAGEALAADKLAQTADVQPVNSTDLPADGNRMRVAIERYNANKSIPPHGIATSAVGGAPAGAAPAN